jgi:7,8-dihydroneopterin aldolase/epimerase/oxygenase
MTATNVMTEPTETTVMTAMNDLPTPSAAPTQSIFITGLRIDARIGVHAHEKGRYQPLKLDAEIDISDAKFHPARDRLEEVFDYQAARAAIIAVIDHGHIHLLETLAERVIARLFDMPDVHAVKVRITKFTAFDDCDAVGVQVYRRRPQ